MLFSILLQISLILNGLVVPRIILKDFGSEVNGLITSLNQFLNYISLLEGGVSGVAMASLYRPLAEKDWQKVSSIYAAINSFFRNIGRIYIFYALAVAAIYPLVVNTGFHYGYIFSMTMILAMTLLNQYFFSLSYRVLLNADRQVFFTSLVQIIVVALNLTVVVILHLMGQGVHVIKLAGGLVMLVQPLLFYRYAQKCYDLDRNAVPDKDALKQRWDGFGQNLAFYIHSNTDVILLTLFSTLSNVSVYAVYMLAGNAIRGFLDGIAAGFNPALGNALVIEPKEKVNSRLDKYEFTIFFAASYLFTNAIILIRPFVSLYTRGILDAEYDQPVFGFIIMLAMAIYCLRAPYVGTVFAAGHFRRTNRIAFTEAALNLGISLLLIRNFGLIGIAIGTLVSVSYRLAAHIEYLRKNILQRSPMRFIGIFLLFFGTGAICIFTFRILLPEAMYAPNWISWLRTAVLSCAYTGIWFLAAGGFHIRIRGGRKKTIRKRGHEE